MKKFLITDYGAVSSSEELQTKNIQACINACHETGGGEVVVPPGIFLIGSLRLFSHITLRLQAGAVLLGSKNYQDYEDFHVPSTIRYLHDDYYVSQWNLPPYYFYALITAYQAEDIRIIGEPGSVIDGQDTFDANGEEKFRGPMGMIFSQVEGLYLEGYTFQNSANWSHCIDGSTDVTINKVHIKAGHDGFNLHHSNGIKVSECHLECGDDCFAGYDVRNLQVKDSYLNTACNALRIGGVQLSFKNCTFEGPGHYPHISENSYYTHAIFKYYAMKADPAEVEGQDIQLINCKVSGADKLLYYNFGRKEIMQEDSPLRELTLEGIEISNLSKSSIFKGNGEKVQLTMKNVQLDLPEGSCFLEIDESVSLHLENVEFVHPFKILVSGKQVLSFNGLTNFSLDVWAKE